MLAAAMLISAPTTYAEESSAGSTPDNPVVMDFDDIDTSVYEGEWRYTDLGFDVYLPADWVEAELTDEMEAAGVVHLYGEDGGGANIVFTRAEVPADYDYEQLGSELAASNTVAMYMDLSGILAVVFENEETKVSGFCTLTDDNYLITGVISAPTDDQYEEYSPYFQNIITSISPSEEEYPELNWEDYEEDVEELEAGMDFASLDDVAMKIWIPSILSEVELDEEDIDDGVIAQYAEDGGDAQLAVLYLEGDEDLTLEDLEETLTENDVTDIEHFVVNGMEALDYVDEEADALYVIFLTDEGDIVEFVFYPASDEGFYSIAQFMTASIQAE